MLLSALVTLSGCTADATRSTPVPPSGMKAGSGSDGGPEPRMTPIENAAQCTTRRSLDQSEAAGVPLTDMFLGFSSGGGALPDETRLGPDGADVTRCPGELPEQPWCGEGVPWSGLGWNAFLTASGATRVLRSEALSIPVGVVGGAGPDDPRTQWVSYREYDVAPGDPKGLAGYLRAAFARCAHATPVTVHGLTAMMGRVPSEWGAGREVDVVLFLTPERAAWVQLDGRRWTPAERAHALKVISSHLK